MNNKELDIKINAILNTADAAQGIGDLKKSLREMLDLTVQLGEDSPESLNKVTQAAGQISDRIKDTRASINSLSGKPIENIAGSLNLVKSSLGGLDFKQASTGIKAMADNLKGFKLNDLSSGFKDIGNSLAALGKALLTNPLFLLASVIALIIVNFDKLKAAGGALGKVLGAVGDTIKGIISLFTMLTDWLHLTEVASIEKTEAILEGLEAEKKAIGDRYAFESKIATDLGISTAAAEVKKIQDTKDNAVKTTAIYEEIKKKRGELNEEETKKYKESLDEQIKADEDYFEFFIRIGEKIEKARKDSELNIRQSKIDAMADGAAKVAAQEKLNLDKGTVELNKTLEERKDDINTHYDALIKQQKDAGLSGVYWEKIKNEKLAEVDRQFAEQQKANVSISAKREREVRLQSIASIISDRQKLLQTQLTTELSDSRNSNKQKLQITLDNIDQQAKLSKEAYEVQFKQASGNKEKQKALTEQQYADQVKFEQDKFNLRKDYHNKDRQMVLETESDILSTNIKIAQSHKDLAISLEKIHKADKELIEANLQKELTDLKNANEEKIASGKYTAEQLALFNANYLDNVEAANKLAKNKQDQLDKEFAEQTKTRIQDNLLETNEIELENIQKRNGFHLEAERTLLDQILKLRKEKLEQQRLAEVEAAGTNQSEIASINEKYRVLNEEAELQTSQRKRQLWAEEQQGKLQVAQAGASALGALNDLITQSENANLKKGEKLSIQAQKRQFERGKALGIVSAVINTAQGIVSALATSGPPWIGIAMAAIVGAMGALQIAKIASAKFNPESPSSGGGAGGGLTPPNITAPPQLGDINSGSFNPNKLNQIGKSSNPLNGIQMQPQKVYVTQTDIADANKVAVVTHDRSTLNGKTN